MIIETSITFGDIITLVSLLVGILLAFWQLNVSNKQNRAQIILGMMDKHYGDDNMLQMLYLLEYETFIFDKTKFPMCPEEKMLDKLLYTFEQVAKLYEMGILKRKDLSLIEYDYLRVFTNNEVQKYFQFLDDTPSGFTSEKSDYQSFRRIAKKMLDKYRLNKTSP